MSAFIPLTWIDLKKSWTILRHAIGSEEVEIYQMSYDNEPHSIERLGNCGLVLRIDGEMVSGLLTAPATSVATPPSQASYFPDRMIDLTSTTQGVSRALAANELEEIDVLIRRSDLKIGVWQ